MRPRIGEAPPVEIATTSGLRSRIEGMMKSQKRGRSATLTRAPAPFAADQASAAKRSSSDRYKAERAVFEILGFGVARLVLKVRLVEKLAKIVAERGSECRHASAGLDEMFRPSRRRRAAAHDDCSLAAKVEKDRQMAHGYPTPDRIAGGAPSPRGGLRRAGVQFTRRPF